MKKSLSKALKVPMNFSGTLLLFLKERLTLSVRQIKRAIDEKGVRVSGKVVTRSTLPLLGGEAISIKLPEEVSPPETLYEDEAILILFKPSGLESHPKKLGLNVGNYLVHRLDRETSGVLLVAKSKKVLVALQEQFEMRKVDKIYIAVVQGRMPGREGKISFPIAKVGEKEGRPIYGRDERGKSALTQWKVWKESKTTTHVICQPITGRTHQIRVHLAGIGHPIVGDTHYGSKISYERILLHAFKISFIHPLSGEKVAFKSQIEL